jgi:uncharacterized membrane protein
MVSSNEECSSAHKSISLYGVRKHASSRAYYMYVLETLWWTTLTNLVLALSAVNNLMFDNFKLIFILIFLALGILFIHSMLRLWLLIRRYNKRDEHRLSNESFAHIERPIHVVLARDEELGIGNGGNAMDEPEADRIEKTITPPPPAYGLWRGSVVS